MSSPAPTTFMAILIIALVVIVWWRITLVVVGAVMVTVLIFGLNEVMDRIDAMASTETVTGSQSGLSPLGDDGNPTGR